jgi:hypothetical protein
MFSAVESSALWKTENNPLLAIYIPDARQRAIVPDWLKPM